MRGFLSLYAVLSIVMMSGVLLFVILSFSQFTAWADQNKGESLNGALGTRIQTINEIKRISGVSTHILLDQGITVSPDSFSVGNQTFSCRDCCIELIDGVIHT